MLRACISAPIVLADDVAGVVVSCDLGFCLLLHLFAVVPVVGDLTLFHVLVLRLESPHLPGKVMSREKEYRGCKMVTEMCC